MLKTKGPSNKQQIIARLQAQNDAAVMILVFVGAVAVVALIASAKST